MQPIPQTDPIYRSIIDSNSAEVRQRLITKIERQIGGRLVTYTASALHPASSIMQLDAVPFEDVLRSVADSDTGFLMLTSQGGDPNAAEKLLLMFRKRFSKSFQVIVPNYAKSAATSICLGADKILMGYMAELGPVDPQIQTSATGGATIPARSFIDGLEMIRHKVKDEGDNPAMYLPMLSQIKPELIAIAQSAIDDSRQTASKWLKNYMLKDNPEQADLVAKLLSEGLTYKSHGKVINCAEARDVLKLNAEEIDHNTPLWSDIWELYLRTMFYTQTSGSAKVFESAKVSLGMQIQIIQTQPAPAAPVQPPRATHSQPENPPKPEPPSASPPSS